MEVKVGWKGGEGWFEGRKGERREGRKGGVGGIEERRQRQEGKKEGVREGREGFLSTPPVAASHYRGNLERTNIQKRIFVEENIATTRRLNRKSVFSRLR